MEFYLCGFLVLFFYVPKIWVTSGGASWYIKYVCVCVYIHVDNIRY